MRVGILSFMMFDYIGQFIFPFALAVPSMYFASRYLLRKTGLYGIRVILISASLAFLYAISPTAFYFSHWYNYASFYAFLPATITGADYALEKGNYLLLAIISAVSSTDPRGFVFTLFIVLTMTLYKRGFYTFLKSVIPYLLLESRVFLYLLLGHSYYSQLSLDIESGQLWINYQTYSILESMRGIGVFNPDVTFYTGNLFFFYPISFIFIETGILGYLFLKKRKSISTYLLFLYLFTVLFITSTVPLGPFTITLDLIYPLLHVLQNTFAYGYLWIILPTYISEMVMAPLFLLVAMVLGEMSKRKILLPVLVMVLVSQGIFSSPAVLSGNYFGEYVTHDPPPIMMNLADFLKGSQGDVAFLGYGVGYSSYLDDLPHDLDPYGFMNHKQASLPFTQVSAEELNALGFQYVVTEGMKPNVTNLIPVWSEGNITVYKNMDFTYEINSPVYVYTSFNQLLGLNKSVNVLPEYLMYSISPKYLGGILGGNQAERIAFLYYKEYGIKPVSLEVKHLPYPTNFTDSIYTTYEILDVENAYPYLFFYEVGNNSFLNLNVSQGVYRVIFEYVSLPGGGVFSVFNGTTSVSVNTNSSMNLNFYCAGEIRDSGELQLRFTGDSISLLAGVILIPVNLKLNGTMNAVPITSYPNSGSLLGRSFSEPTSMSHLDLELSLNGVTTLALMLFVLRKHIIKWIKEVTAHI
ncbi:hypothetical protein [Sulfuracidifex tepidarius]|nr:hypothetical protein [Sulfuracidifex tepidarius]